MVLLPYPGVFQIPVRISGGITRGWVVFLLSQLASWPLLTGGGECTVSVAKAHRQDSNSPIYEMGSFVTATRFRKSPLPTPILFFLLWSSYRPCLLSWGHDCLVIKKNKTGNKTKNFLHTRPYVNHFTCILSFKSPDTLWMDTNSLYFTTEKKTKTLKNKKQALREKETYSRSHN